MDVESDEKGSIVWTCLRTTGLEHSANVKK